MREILFRGKRIDNGEWVYGDLVQSPAYCVVQIYEQDLCGDNFAVDPSTVGQYTGLTDKNGKKIFEGDIVKHYFSKRFDPIVGRVAFDGHDCRLKLYSCTDGTESGFYRGCIYEVIGNIHDNPELLEDKP